MRNIDTLRDQAYDVFEGLRNGTVDPKAAVEMNNAVGKIINTVKVELEYAELSKTTPNIPFLHYEKPTVEGDTK